MVSVQGLTAMKGAQEGKDRLLEFRYGERSLQVEERTGGVRQPPPHQKGNKPELIRRVPDQ